MEGVVGLAPDDPSNGPSFIQALKDSKLIDKAMFGMYLGKAAIQSSYITYGGYDSTKMMNGS